MFTPIKQTVGKGLSALAGFALLIVTLPLTFGIMLLAVTGGIVAMLTLRYRMNSAAAKRPGWHSQPDLRDSQSVASQKPPIEGSYTVIDK